MTDPFRMAAVLIHARRDQAELYAEARQAEANKLGARSDADWWGRVRSAVVELRVTLPPTSDDSIH